MDYRNISVGDKVVFTPNENTNMLWADEAVVEQEENGGYFTVHSVCIVNEDVNKAQGVRVEESEYMFSVDWLEPFVEETTPPCQVGGDLDEV